MHPKVKSRPAGGIPSGNGVEPLLPHEVPKQTASIKSASRRSTMPTKSMSGVTAHARHHVSRQTQS